MVRVTADHPLKTFFDFARPPVRAFGVWCQPICIYNIFFFAMFRWISIQPDPSISWRWYCERMCTVAVSVTGRSLWACPGCAKWLRFVRNALWGLSLLLVHSWIFIFESDYIGLVWSLLASYFPNFSVTWLILPAVICLDKRLSHACLRTLSKNESAYGSL